MTIYEQNPKIWDNIAAQGRPNVVRLSKRFSDYKDMDKALGYTKACSNWVNRGGSVSQVAENAARNWLEANPEPEKPTSDGILMVIPPVEKIDAVKRVLTALGCEVVDI